MLYVNVIEKKARVMEDEDLLVCVCYGGLRRKPEKKGDVCRW